MRILIIGGTRFIGPRVAARLATQGHLVTVAHRGVHNATLHPDVAVVRNPDLGLPIRRIPDELRRLEPEVVIHMIAMGEEDSESAVQAFSGVSRRLIALSSGDVYKAYGIFMGIDSGPIVATPLAEGATIRSIQYPYRRAETPPESLAFWYDKVLAEQALRSDLRLPATILRLPKVYGPEDNGDLRTVYAFRHAPTWRWTHGHVENVAKAIVLTVTDDRATGQTYNVGEEHVPTMAERLLTLPDRPDVGLETGPYRFEQNMNYDTSKIRGHLGYVEDIDETSAMRSVAILSSNRKKE